MQLMISRPADPVSDSPPHPAKGGVPSPRRGEDASPQGERVRGRVAPFFAIAFASFACALPARAENATIRRVVDGYVTPAYADAHETAATVRGDMERLCGDPSAASVASARADFVALVAAWSRIEAVRFGPVTEQNRLERILFWPDRKSIGLKQVQAAIAAKDPTASDPATLAQKSVAMQGLGALEFVLFGAGSETLEANGDLYRCEYGRAIATNVERMLAEIQTGWSEPAGIAAQWTNPGPDNPLFRDDAEAMTELLDVLVHGMELVRDVRINGFLGEAPDGDKPKQAVFWRAEASVVSIEANLAGLLALFDAADFAPLLPADQTWLPGSVDFEFSNAATALAGLDGPVDALLADPVRRDRLAYARLVTSSLSDLLGDKLAPALGLTSGFSSLDGD